MILLYYLTILALTLDLALTYMNTVFDNLYVGLGLAAGHLVVGRVFIIVLQWKTVRLNSYGNFVNILFDKSVRGFMIYHLARILYIFIRIVLYLVLDNGVGASAASGLRTANVVLAWIDFAIAVVETPVFYYVFLVQTIKQLYVLDE